MNRNHMLKRKVTAAFAVGMAVVVGSVPVAMASGTQKTEQENPEAISKEETVYVNADAYGTPEQITVSSWLKNAGQESLVEDQSDLTDIKNVKGDETFQEKDEMLLWSTAGSDIFYQGNSDKELPVSVTFMYYLDGKEVKPEELAGKSGHLQIRIQYENHEKRSARVDGKKETVYSPFVMLTAMILPEDTFSNVSIDNGRVISDGSRSIAVGVGMPGLEESLKLDTLSLHDEKENSISIDIPDSVEIRADVTDFSMGSTFTIALSDLLDGFDPEDTEGLDSLRDSLDELADAAVRLADGSQVLFDCVGELDEQYGEFDDGVKELKDGTDELAEGTDELQSGVEELTEGAGELQSGASEQLSAARTSLQQQYDAAAAAQNAELAAALQTAMDSIETVSVSVEAPSYMAVSHIDDLSLPELNIDLNALNDQMNSLETSFAEIQTSVSTLITTLTDVQTGLDGLAQMKEQIPENPLDPLSEGVTDLNTQMQSFYAATSSLSASVAQLDTNTESLPAAAVGIQSLLDGFDQLSGNNETLASGTAALKSSSAAVNAGAAALQSGICQLLDGLNQLSSQLTTGAGALSASSQTLRSGAADLTCGASSLRTGADTLKSGTDALKGGADALKSGTETLADGVSQLQEGAATLSDASDEVAEGISKLKDGAEELNDSMQEFNEDGISQLKELADEDLTIILDRIKALFSDEVAYDTYSGRSSHMDGSVKFIIETDPIE